MLLVIDGSFGFEMETFEYDGARCGTGRAALEGLGRGGRNARAAAKRDGVCFSDKSSETGQRGNPFGTQIRGIIFREVPAPILGTGPR